MSNKTNIMLGVSLALFLILGFGVLVVPKMNRQALADAQFEGFRAELEKPNAGPQTVTMLNDRLEILRQLGEDRITPIPDEPDLAGLMSSMSTMFAQHGLEPPQLTTGTPEPDRGAMSMPMTIVAEGEFVPLAQAILGIESLDRLVRVRRVRISTDSPRRNGPVDREGLVRADLLLDVFYGTQLVDAQEDDR